jgi:antitoxin (DNA-binding transcriptional repressor) of toxin-antitoxin stability system
MEKIVSKSRFKPRALEYFRQIEETRQALTITDRGKPVLRIEPIEEAPSSEAEILEKLRGSVLGYDDPFEPVGIEDWEALK